MPANEQCLSNFRAFSGPKLISLCARPSSCSSTLKDIDEDGGASGGPKLPPLPAEGLEFGVLPRVIRTLVERRAVVKKMLKKEKARADLRKRDDAIDLWPIFYRPYI